MKIGIFENVQLDRRFTVLGTAFLLVACAGVARAQSVDCNDPDSPQPIICHDVPKAWLTPGYPYYVGHDEPLIQFFSNTPGSGNNVQWKIRLPNADPVPTQNGASVANFELYPTFWFSMALCDPASKPFNACTPNSDSNTAAAGAAILELQFYPPGANYGGGFFCSDTSKWCAQLTIDELTTNCGEPITAKFITTDGTPGGPKLVMSPADRILITIKDSAAGLSITVNDLTSAATGSMVASGANGFTQTLETSHMPLGNPPPPGTCSTAAFSYHPEYLTASPANNGSWFGDNISLSYEIGHWELCGDAACMTLPDPPDPMSSMDDTGCVTALGVGGCSGTDGDHDGLSYLTDWPDGNASHPSTLIIGNALDNGVGPLSFAGGSYQAPYGKIFFGGSVGGPFYPFYSQAGTGTSCVFNFGNDIPGTTTNDFGQTAQYGTTITNSCGGAPPPSISKAFGALTIPLGQTTTVTFTITNPNAFLLTGVRFNDSLPAGLPQVGSVVGTGCGGFSFGGLPGAINITNATIAAGGTCTITTGVFGGTAGVKMNVTSNVLANESTSPGNTATASITVVAPPSINKSFTAPKILPGGVTAVNFFVSNPNNFIALTGVTFTDTFPLGMVVASSPGLTSNCPVGTVFTGATSGSGSVSVTIPSLAASASCTTSVNITAPEGIYTNSVTVTSTNGGTGNTSTAQLIAASPPNVSKAFGEVSILPHNSTTLTFTLTNPNHVVTLTGLAFSDTLPAGLVVSTPNGLTGPCDGATPTAAAGSNVIALAGATLAPGASCTFSVNVTATGAALGYVINTTSTVTSNEALPGAPASATLFIGDPFQISYSSNLSFADSAVNISNSGANASAVNPVTQALNGNLCVNVYTFSPDEQMVACCSCHVTPNALWSLSARSDLVSNTLTPGVPTSVVVKLVATLAGPGGASGPGTTTAPTCNPATIVPLGPAGTANSLALGLTAWSTTIHGLGPSAVLPPGGTTPPPGTALALTEKEFTKGTLSAAELTRLSTLCGFIQGNGSGFGICKSCRLGGLSGVSR
jgi:hypothetical protein